LSKQLYEDKCGIDLAVGAVISSGDY